MPDVCVILRRGRAIYYRYVTYYITRLRFGIDLNMGWATGLWSIVLIRDYYNMTRADILMASRSTFTDDNSEKLAAA